MRSKGSLRLCPPSLAKGWVVHLVVCPRGIQSIMISLNHRQLIRIGSWLSEWRSVMSFVRQLSMKLYRIPSSATIPSNFRTCRTVPATAPSLDLEETSPVRELNNIASEPSGRGYQGTDNSDPRISIYYPDTSQDKRVMFTTNKIHQRSFSKTMNSTITSNCLLRTTALAAEGTH